MFLLYKKTRVKRKMLFSILLLLFILVSCRAEPASDEVIIGTFVEESYELTEPEPTRTNVASEQSEPVQETLAKSLTTTLAPTSQPQVTPPTTFAAITPEPAPPREPVILSTENLLEDFDYFTHTLEESFPFYGAAQRKFGIDLHRQKALARAEIERLDTTGNDSWILSAFADILSRHIITPMRIMGHLQGLWAGSSSHKIQLALIKWDGIFETSWYPNLYADHLHDVFTSPTALRYYGDALEGIDLEQFIQDTLRTPVANNVTFDIIQPGSVAYMRMNAMPSANHAYDGALIAAFGETIGGFEHFIIDLRGNRGGSAGNFLQNVIAPLIDEPATLFYYVFFKGGQHAMMFDDIYYRDLQWQLANGLLLHADAPRFPVSDILPSLTHANAEDFASLSYGFKREITVTPSANRWAFNGKIWILTDRYSISAAEISSAVAKESGFATLVGEPTGGAFGGYTAAFINLPNTGIIMRYDYGYVTDLQGRSIEELGVAPDIYNRPGMDAFQTVMSLIAEKNY